MVIFILISGDIYAYHIKAYKIYVINFENKMDITANIKIFLDTKDTNCKFYMPSIIKINSIMLLKEKHFFPMNYLFKSDTLLLIFPNLNNRYINFRITYSIDISKFNYNGFCILKSKWYPYQKNNIASFMVTILSPLEFRAISGGNFIYEKKNKKYYIQKFYLSKGTEIPLIIYPFDSVQCLKKKLNGTLIKFIYTTDYSENLKDIFKKISFSFSSCSKIFGKYPYKSIFIFEYPSNDFISPQTISNVIIFVKISVNYYSKREDYWPSHETTHLWWGYIIFINSTSKGRRFIEETMTESIKDIEYKLFNTIENYNLCIDFHKMMLSDTNNKNQTVNLLEIDDLTVISNSLNIYQKGPLLLDSLFNKFGIKRILQLIHKFYNKYKDKIIYYDDLDLFISNYLPDFYAIFKQLILNCG